MRTLESDERRHIDIDRMCSSYPTKYAGQIAIAAFAIHTNEARGEKKWSESVIALPYL